MSKHQNATENTAVQAYNPSSHSERNVTVDTPHTSATSYLPTPEEHRTSENLLFSCRDALSNRPLTMKASTVDITANDLVTTTDFTQTFVNDTRYPLEVVYTFPTTWRSMVARFAATLQGETLVAQALPCRDAWKTYDDARRTGDGSALLELQSDGLATARFANLLPGEEPTLAVTTVTRTV